jgi:hypothetical protein
MLYLGMSFSVLLVLLFGYIFYLSSEITNLNKKIDIQQTRSDKPVSADQ